MESYVSQAVILPLLTILAIYYSARTMVYDCVRLPSHLPCTTIVPAGEDEWKILWQLIRPTFFDALDQFLIQKFVSNGGEMEPCESLVQMDLINVMAKDMQTNRQTSIL